jgi:hypothetical protein
MGPNLNRKLDVEGVDAALQRAAARATHGNRAERSGRFLPAKKNPASSARRGSKQPGPRRRKA